MNQLRFHSFSHLLKIFLKAMGALLTMITSKSLLFPFFSLPESPQLPQKNALSEPEKLKESEQSGPFNRLQRLTVKPTNYAWFHNLWNPRLKNFEGSNS